MTIVQLSLKITQALGDLLGVPIRHLAYSSVQGTNELALAFGSTVQVYRSRTFTSWVFCMGEHIVTLRF